MADMDTIAFATCEKISFKMIDSPDLKVDLSAIC